MIYMKRWKISLQYSPLSKNLTTPLNLKVEGPLWAESGRRQPRKRKKTCHIGRFNLKNTNSANQINWFGSAQYSFSPDRFEIALTEVLKLIQANFLKTYVFTSVENLHVDLEGFLLIHRTTNGPAGYPTLDNPHITYPRVIKLKFFPNPYINVCFIATQSSSH